MERYTPHVPPSAETQAISAVTDILLAFNTLRIAMAEPEMNDLVKTYLGDIGSASSFLRQDRKASFTRGEEGRYAKKPAHPDSLPPYVEMMNDLHKLVRYELPKRLRIRIDKEKLQPQTQALLAEVDACVLDFHQSVKHVQKERDVTFIEPAELKEIPEIKVQIDRSHTLMQALLASELATARTVPITVDGAPVLADNRENLGLLVHAMTIATDYLMDSLKVPEGINTYLQKALQTGKHLPTDTMRNVFRTNSATSAQFDKTYAELLPQMQQALSKGSHVLQILNLIRDDRRKNDPADVADMLLKKAGLASYPDRLESPEEYALVKKAFLQFTEADRPQARPNLSSLRRQEIRTAQRSLLEEYDSRAERFADATISQKDAEPPAR